MDAAQEAYIDKSLRPVLEELAEMALEDLPEGHAGLRQYFLDHLESKRNKEKGEAAAATDQPPARLDQLRTQNKRLIEDYESLQAYCTELERMIIQIAPEEEQIYEDVLDGSLAGAVKEAELLLEEDSAEDEDDDSEDDWCDELPDMMKNNFMDVLRPRSSVSAEAYGAWNKKKEFVALIYPKTAEEKEQLRAILSKSFMFAALKPADLETTIDSVRSEHIAKDVEVIAEGDDGACLYIVGSGSLGCYKAKILDDNGTPKLLKKVVAGDVFGELALLYNCPRAATVKALEDSQLWQLDRDTFNHIVRDASAKVREENEAFVKKVKLFGNLDVYERSRMAECLREVECKAGDYVIRQGEQGDRMFFIVEGKLEATKNKDEGGEDTVFTYSPGDFFGEIAILRNCQRQANVVARTDSKVMALLADDFIRLFGTLQDRMKENMKKYKGLKQ